MIYKDCRDCKKYPGNCGNHYIDSDKHINYDIASETYYDDAIGNYASCFEMSDRCREELKTQVVKEIVNNYTLDEIKAAVMLIEERDKR